MENNKGKGVKRLTGFATILFIFLFGARISSCSAPEKTLYATPKELPTKELQDGRKLFNEYCASCHPGGMSGVGLAIINKPLPEFLIEFQIRNGVGVMPAFDKKMLTHKQVEQIAEYLVYLRKKD